LWLGNIGTGLLRVSHRMAIFDRLASPLSSGPGRDRVDHAVLPT